MGLFQTGFLVLPHVLQYNKPESLHSYFTPTLQKPEGFRVKATEGDVVVLYFEPSATQNLKSSGFPAGQTTWQNRPHPSNSPMAVSNNLSFCKDIGYNCGPLFNLCHGVYATKGFSICGGLGRSAEDFKAKHCEPASHLRA